MRVIPYVYRLTHKETGQFYIGYREANRIQSHLDLPIYQTSSEYISDIGFDKFNWEIVAEFFDGAHAYDFENELIKESFDNPLCLNKHYKLHKIGEARFKITEESISKMAVSKTGKTLSEETKRRMSESRFGKIQSEETKKKRSNTLKGRKLPDETKLKIKQAALRRFAKGGLNDSV